MEDLGYAYFLRRTLQITGIDLARYKEGQMRRRLGTLMVRHGAQSFVQYYKMLEQDAQLLQEFRDFFTINVSEFFRDPIRFQQLQTVVLPELMRHRRKLRFWSAGCSNGAEPYTLAIIMEEMAYPDYSILATDIDEASLARAITGAAYGPRDIKNVPPELMAKCFLKHGNTYDVKPKVKAKVQFRHHDLLADPFEDNFDLISCRNVIIYFTQDAQDRLFRQLYNSLNPGGALFLGAAEVMMHPRKIGFEPRFFSFYFKQE